MDFVIAQIIGSLITAIVVLLGVIKILGNNKKNYNPENHFSEIREDHIKIIACLNEMIRTLQRIEDKIK